MGAAERLPETRRSLYEGADCAAGIFSRAAAGFPEPIISSPFDEPQEHWNIVEGEIPEKVAGRRKALYFYRDPKSVPGKRAGESRDVREVVHSHVNYAVADTKRWEQSAAFYLDRQPAVLSFVKNAGLGFAVPYLHNGQMHDYVPDFIVRMKCNGRGHLILETKGFDPLADIKRAAAERWAAAVNSEGSFGRWHYRVARKIEEIPPIIEAAARWSSDSAGKVHE